MFAYIVPVVLKALADKTRLALLNEISKRPVCACELPAKVKKTQPAVSQHLAVLRDAGLVEMKRDGAKRIYSLSTFGQTALAAVSGWK